MNDKTGEIRPMTAEEAARLNSIADPKKDGLWHDVSALSEPERKRLQGMNRRNRKAFLKGLRGGIEHD